MALISKNHRNILTRQPKSLPEGEYTFELVQLAVRLIGSKTKQERLYIVGRSDEHGVRNFEVPIVWSSIDAQYPDARHLKLFLNLLAATDATAPEDAEEGPSIFGHDEAGEPMHLAIGRYDVPDGVCFTAKLTQRDANDFERSQQRCDVRDKTNVLVEVLA